MQPEFVGFQKISRLSRDIIVTEKIDGTNASVYVGDDGEVLAGSRTRWLTTSTDNFGFAAWVHEREDELRGLGPGTHYGEWWGSGIQRGYGLSKGEKRFSLFNVVRWSDEWNGVVPLVKRPACCGVVPVLYQGPFQTVYVDACLDRLREMGSVAVPGYIKPEGVVVYHTHGRVLFKKTIEKDDEHKGYKVAA